MISYLLFSTILMIASFPHLVAAETAQNHWKVPNGNQADFSQTFTNGEILPIAWNGWNSEWTDDFLDGTTVANLWVTSYNYKSYQYTQELTKGVDISEDGSYTWTINVNATSLGNTAEYVLRFMRPYDTYNSTGLQLSSRGFIILPAKATTTSSATSITTISSQTTVTASHTSTSIMTNPPTSPPAPTTTTPATATTSTSQPSGLSSGAKAGIGIGSTVGGIAILGILGFAFRRRFMQKPPAAPQTDILPGYQNNIAPTFKEPKPLHPQELPAFSAPVELDSRPCSR
ncbi:hypothetical protein PISL3812_04143 [Talaromyces islandicus]|uniref:Uncharacterized protein n=1 Tax=Talaromyces islandicus TaxID=28573 RepID=A0A0U1LUN9_TALIS|nr:hypothetical protein PISL3812_04143 [Talaromyces islandicus]